MIITENLRKFARLFVRVGGNVQPGQNVVITSEIANADFARLVAEAAYDAGARDVHFNWLDELSVHTRYLRAAEDVFVTYPNWMVNRLAEWDDSGAVYLHIDSENPDLMTDVSAVRLKNAAKARRAATKKHSDITMSNGVRWSIVGVPTVEWAMKVFPGNTPDEAIDKLWEAILKVSRVSGEDDPVEAWAQHNANFQARMDFLNGHNFRFLKYKNSIGTDVTVELPEGHLWLGGGELAKDGVFFNPNIPTEEVFTLPKRGGVNGKLVSSMPLLYQGKLIEDFEIDFKDGKAVSLKAGKNEETLRNIIENDEGAAYLGEVALVGCSSPITQTGIMFYNTLFDENAACHFALGKAYPTCVKGGEDMSEAELAAIGVNDSLVHVDFMVGTADLSIIGEKDDGTEIPVFVNGDFADIRQPL